MRQLSNDSKDKQDHFIQEKCFNTSSACIRPNPLTLSHVSYIFNVISYSYHIAGIEYLSGFGHTPILQIQMDACMNSANFIQSDYKPTTYPIHGGLK